MGSIPVGGAKERGCNASPLFGSPDGREISFQVASEPARIIKILKKGLCR